LWPQAAEAEHGQGDEGAGVAESECHSGDDTDFGVDGFDQAVAELVFQCCFYSFAVRSYGPAELGELGDAAAGGPGQPPVEGLGGCPGLALELEDDPDAFLEQPGPV
jgi:hypothetical protein